jgi:hypothetical protein
LRYFDKVEFELQKMLELVDEMENPDDKFRRHAGKYLDVVQEARRPARGHGIKSRVK